MRTIRSTVLVGLALVASLGACGEPEECDYFRPIASITSDIDVFEIEESFTLTAATSEIACNRDHSYSWTFQSVPADSAVTNSIWQGNNTPAAGNQTLNLDVPGTYVVKVTIFDGIQNSVEDIFVIEVSADNLRPEADAGDDQGAIVGDIATLDGSGSSDPDGEDGLPGEYRWRLEEAPADSQRTNSDIYAADEAVAQFVPDRPGRYVFSLAVADDFVWSAKDFVSVVTPSDNEPPVAEASDFDDPVVNRTPCESVDPIPLNGTRSYDPEGENLTYEWGVQSVPDGSSASNDDFTDRSDARARFNADVPGQYVFELRVSDGELWSAWDVVTVNTQDPELNTVPTANAGEDMRIDAEVFCRSTASGRTCNPCPNTPFELNGQLNTVDPDGDSLNYLWVQTSGPPMTLSYPGGPITKAFPGEIEAEFGKTSTRTWEILLKTSDCGGETEDSITLTYTCTGSE